jgi:putative flippase GtrA
MRKLVSFSAIGVLNTIIHTGIVVTMVESGVLHPVAANTIGFVVANAFSFFANTRWSFRSAITFKAYRRFLLVSIAGLATTILASAAVSQAELHYAFGLVAVFIALPLLTFTIHLRWTFNQRG